MEFFPPVVFEVKAKVGEAMASFGALNKELSVMAKNADTVSGRMGLMTTSAKYARTAILGLGGAFAVMGAAGLAEIMSEEKAMARLQIAIEKTGVSFQQALPYIEQQAKAMIKLGFADDEAYDAITKMTAATGSPAVALKNLALAADLARFNQISLAEAGSVVAKASVGATRGLMELGLKMGVTIPKGADLATIMKLVEERVGGTANAFGNTLAGKVAIANANFDELKEKIGVELLPYAIQLTDWITNVAIPKFSEFTDFLKRNKTALVNFGMAIAGFWAGGKIVAGIMAVVKAVNVLRDAYIVTGIAATFATGGVSMVTALGTLAAVGVTTKVLMDIINKKNTSGSTGGVVAGQIPTGAYAGPAAGTYGPTPSLKGKGVVRVPQSTDTSSNKTTVQNITVYASNTNDIAKKLAQAAKNGQPIGGK